MTNEEAIKLIDDRMCFGRGRWSEHHRPVIDEYWQAGEMAIKALEQPKIIYCKDCKYWHSGSCEYPEHAVNCQDYWVGDIETEAEHFCGYAERRGVTT